MLTSLMDLLDESPISFFLKLLEGFLTLMTIVIQDNKMKVKLNVKFFLLVVVMSFGLLTLLPWLSVSTSQPNSIKGTLNEAFSIGKTNSSTRLLRQSPVPGHIGSTFNLSISLSSNSTSGVHFVFGAYDYYAYWEGPKEFDLAPNESYNAIYVQHFASDAGAPFWIDYSLTTPTLNASGMFSIKRIHVGYFVNVGTGELYIENITAWLLSQPKSTTTSSTTTPSTHTTTSIELATILVGVTVVFLRRIRKR